MSEISFDDRFGMLVDQEYQSRKNNRLKRLIHNADFEQPDAHIADIDYRSGRKLNKGLIERMARCEYITSIGTSLLQELPEVARHTWHVPSAWKPANNITL